MKDKDKAGLLQAMQNKAQTTKRKNNRMQRTHELQENWIVWVSSSWPGFHLKK